VFKRLTWLGVGVVAGLGTSKWAERRAKAALARYLPVGRLPAQAGSQAASWARSRVESKLSDLRLGVEEGRLEMATREDELRSRLQGSAARSATGRPLGLVPGGGPPIEVGPSVPTALAAGRRAPRPTRPRGIPARRPGA
jgi:hypothetical protein